MIRAARRGFETMHSVTSRLRLVVTAIAALWLGLGFVPEAHADKPGAIRNVWLLEGGGPSDGDGGRGQAFRILYRSTGLKGEPIEVSGAIFIPEGKAPPGGRDVIAWAHPTSGVVEKCAPSLMPDAAGVIWGLS
jgi:hypothetical protein